MSCYGRMKAASLTPKPGAFRTVTADHRHACVVDDEGGFACWGDGVLKVPAAELPDGREVAIKRVVRAGSGGRRFDAERAFCAELWLLSRVNHRNLDAIEAWARRRTRHPSGTRARQGPGSGRGARGPESGCGGGRSGRPACARVARGGAGREAGRLGGAAPAFASPSAGICPSLRCVAAGRRAPASRRTPAR